MHEKHAWLDDLTNFQLVCFSFYAFTHTHNLDLFVREHPITAADWLMMKHPIVGQQHNIELVCRIYPYLSSVHYFKLIKNALDIEVVQELSQMTEYFPSRNPISPISPLLDQHQPGEYLIFES